jgi:hypothetical protein
MPDDIHPPRPILSRKDHPARARSPRRVIVDAP